MSYLLIASVYDTNTEKVYAQLKDLGFRIVNDPEEFLREIGGSDKIIVMSHGERDKLLIGGREAVTPGNAVVLMDKEGFLIICLVGAYLVPYAAWLAHKKGRKLKMLAFSDRFVFITDERYRPEEDPYLTLIMRPVRAVIVFLKNGGSVKDALKVWREEAEKALKEAESSLDPVMVMTAGMIKHNMYSLKLFDSSNPQPWIGQGVYHLPWWVYALPAIILAFLTAYTEVMRAIREAEKGG